MLESRNDARMRRGVAPVTQPRQPDSQTPTTESLHTAQTPEPSTDSGASNALLKALARQLLGDEPSFHPAQLVAGRFRIVHFLARGGMGEVYEAEDLRLKERVALKAIRQETARDPSAMVRFERELRLARKVTHPNVCRLYDMMTHCSEGRDVTFLSMELLRGTTLSDHLKAKGRLSAAEALPLVRQMCAALEAAHEAGVVHRDFKSANVVLCGSAGKLRVVVTDFGLARRPCTGEGQTETSLTAPGKLVGTPEYMAPEQIEGRELSAATDLYALGLVMYEMLTGTLPFRGDTPVALVQRVREPAPSPRTLVPELDPRWEAAILRCLEREPAKRFQSSAELLAALEDEEQDARPQPTAKRHSFGGQCLTAAVVASLGLLLASGAALRGLSGRPPAPTAALLAPAEIQRTVAVLGYKNLSGAPRLGVALHSALRDARHRAANRQAPEGRAQRGRRSQ